MDADLFSLARPGRRPHQGPFFDLRIGPFQNPSHQRIHYAPEEPGRLNDRDRPPPGLRSAVSDKSLTYSIWGRSPHSSAILPRVSRRSRGGSISTIWKHLSQITPAVFRIRRPYRWPQHSGAPNLECGISVGIISSRMRPPPAYCNALEWPCRGRLSAVYGKSIRSRVCPSHRLAKGPAVSYAVDLDFEDGVTRGLGQAMGRMTDRLRIEVEDGAIDRFGLDLESVTSA
jgi:hypothetical protein